MNGMQKYQQVVGYGSTVSRAATVLGSNSTVLGKSFSEYLADVKAKNPITVKDGLGTILGAVAGAYLGHKRGHVVLGTIAGASVGRNGPALLHAEQRNEALWNMGQTGAAVLASKAVSKHPVIAFAATFIGVGVVRFWKK